MDSFGAKKMVQAVQGLYDELTGPKQMTKPADEIGDSGRIRVSASVAPIAKHSRWTIQTGGAFT